MLYPSVLFFRYQRYSNIDDFFEINKEKLLCNVEIIQDKLKLSKLFKTKDILVTFGENEKEYHADVNSIIANRMKNRWFHVNLLDLEKFNNAVNYCYIENITYSHEKTRPVFSIFTTTFNSYNKILRAYESIKCQTLKDWEWVILDDSTNEDHFDYLRKNLKDDRIRLYKRSENSGNIGNVKNEAVSLCRGKYVLELDHDDEILFYVLNEAAFVFDNDSSIGFVYMDFANIYENKTNFYYGDHFALGYSGYYRQKINDLWVYVAVTPNINNVTLSHIVSVPNHPRIWRRSLLLQIGNYSELLYISDDYELLLRTAVNTNMAKIHKLGYIQYMNDNGNFSLIRNSEINRLRRHLTDHCYKAYNIENVLKEKNAYENYDSSQIWKRKNYNYRYCNKVINFYKKQYCVIGLETVYQNYYQLKHINTDVILLDNKINSDLLCHTLDNLNLDIKCYAMEDCTDEELIRYFHLIYKSCDQFEVIERNQKLQQNYVNLNFKEKRKITVITPCTRTNNLKIIKETIDFNYIDEWVIVYDEKFISNLKMFDDPKIKELCFRGTGVSGNDQRNHGLDNMTYQNTYVFFLDDDNVVHKDIYTLFRELEPNKIYTFDQERSIENYPFIDCLLGNKIELNCIDTSMFLVDYNLCKDIRWDKFKYNSDGIYIVECYSAYKDQWVYINKTMSYYNKI